MSIPTTPTKAPYSPGVMSMIPLYYVGWADSLLSPSERKLIQSKIDQLPFLSDSDKTLLLSWSNPAQPPSDKLFKQWVQLLKNAAAGMPEDTRISLAQLGIEMARKSEISQQDRQLWQHPQTREALEQLEQALAVPNLISFRNVLLPGQQLKHTHQTGPSFDVNAMTHLLDGRFHDLCVKMRVLLSDPAFRLQTLRDKDEYRTQILEWCQLLAVQGLGALSYPKKYGGQDDMGAYCTVFELLGYHDLSLTIKFGVQFGLFGGSVLWLGTDKHHDQYLKDIGTLNLPGCFAMTETGHGSNVRGLETTATYDPQSDEILIHTSTESAGKEYIGNALHSKIATVFAQLIVNNENQGVHAVLVPLRDAQHQLLPGIRVVDNGYKLGLNGIDNGRIWFDQVRVPRHNLLDRFGSIDKNGQYTSPILSQAKRFFSMLGTLVGGRVCVPKAGLSATKVGLSIAIKYALRRRQFAPNEGEAETLLLDYPSHQRRLMPLLAKTYALHFALSWLTERYVKRTEEDIREVETLAAALKSYSSWFTTQSLQECREACGGKGYLAENRFADLKADTDIFTTFEGDNTVLMQLVAKGLLSEMRKEFHDEGFRAVIRFVIDQISTNVTELNPIIIRKTDTEHLLDAEFHLNAFQYRDHRNLVVVSQRMRNLLKKRIDPYDAFLRCQNQLLVLANAYAERIVLERFQLVVANCKQAELQIALQLLCNLFALSTLEYHKGWYLEQEYMSGGKTKAIRRLIDRLCLDASKEALALVDAFAIPEACLAAPIALNE